VRAINSLADAVGLYALTPHGELGLITERCRISIAHTLTKALGPQIRQLLRANLSVSGAARYRLGVAYRGDSRDDSSNDVLDLEEDVKRRLIHFGSGVGHSDGRARDQDHTLGLRSGIRLLIEHRVQPFVDTMVYLPVLYDRGTTLSQYREYENRGDDAQTSRPVVEVLNLMAVFSFARRNERLLTLMTQALKRYVTAERIESAEMSSDTKLKHASPRRDRSRMVDTWQVDISGVGGGEVAAATLPARFEDFERLIEKPPRNVDPGALRTFAPFRKVDHEHLRRVASKSPVHQAPRGVRLLDIGLTDAWNMFLLEGSVTLQAADGDALLVTAGSVKATSPIAFLKPRKYSVTTVTPVKFLWVHDVLL